MHVGIDHRRQVAEPKRGTGNALVALVGDVGVGVLARHRGLVRVVELGTKRLVVVGEAGREQGEAAADVHARRIALGVRRGIVGKSGTLVYAYALAQRSRGFLGHVVVDRPKEPDWMVVIRDNQDQSIVAMRGGPIAGKPDRIVEHDRVVHRALHV